MPVATSSANSWRTHCGGNNILTVKENNIGLIRALAYGWRHKNMYERNMTIEKIAKTEHKAEHTIYKYMALAYLSPKIVANIMAATAPLVDLQTLFTIVAKHMDFKEQEKSFIIATYESILLKFSQRYLYAKNLFFFNSCYFYDRLCRRKNWRNEI